jgi:hypothetical protein
MVEIAVFALVLIAVFAAKAASIVFTADEIIEDSRSFSWVRPDLRDEAIASWEAQPEPERVRSIKPVRVYAHRYPKAA